MPPGLSASAPKHTPHHITVATKLKRGDLQTSQSYLRSSQLVTPIREESSEESSEGWTQRPRLVFLKSRLYESTSSTRQPLGQTALAALPSRGGMGSELLWSPCVLAPHPVLGWLHLPACFSVAPTLYPSHHVAKHTTSIANKS